MNLKNALFGAAIFFSAAGAVTFTACQKDACEKLNCQFGGSCRDGYCHCRTGYEGAECEVKTVNKFIGTYPGNVHCQGFAPLADTVDIFFYAEPDSVTIVRHGAVGAGGMSMYVGKATGNYIQIPDISSGVYHQNITIWLEPNTDKLTYTNVVVSDTSDAANTTSTCTFYGFRQ